MTENCAWAPPPVKPKRTIKAWIKHFKCRHHWVWTMGGRMNQSWGQCTFCRWVVKLRA